MNAEIVYHVRLAGLSRSENEALITAQDKILFCDRKKNEGSTMLKHGRYSIAVRKYKAVISLCEQNELGEVQPIIIIIA